MPYTISLFNISVPPRYDAQDWVSARIEESLVVAGPYTEIETVAIAPTGTPDAPNPINLTTLLATYDYGWYRVVFIGEADDESLPSSPNLVGPSPAYRPTLGEVADFIRARTKDDGGNELGTFTSSTRPTGAAVERIINIVMGTMGNCIGDWLPDRLYHRARLTIAIGAALMVELSYFPEQIEDNQSAYKAYEKLYENMRKDLCAAAAPFQPDDWSPGDTPLFYFGDGAVITEVEYDYATERYMFRGENGIVYAWNT